MKAVSLCQALLEEETGEEENTDFIVKTGGPGLKEDGRASHLEKLKALGLPGLIDAHAHWFPENVMRKIWDYFQKRGWPLTYTHDPSERLEWTRRNGVKHFTTLNYAHRPLMAAWLNDWTAEFVSEVPEAIPCGTFYAEQTAGQDVRRCIEEYGFKGFKLHIQVSEMEPAHPHLSLGYEQIAAAGLPVVMHVGDGPQPGKFTTPAHFRAVLEKHPQLTVIIAHMGASQYEAYLDLARDFEHVYLDTTMIFCSFDFIPAFPSERLASLEGLKSKILFGSDFPSIPYPLTHAVEGVLNLPLSDDAKRDIMWGNAARLFGISSNMAG